VIDVSKEGREQAAGASVTPVVVPAWGRSRQDLGRQAREQAQEAIARGIFPDQHRAEVAWVLDLPCRFHCRARSRGSEG
jgi:hypothetical protein